MIKIKCKKPKKYRLEDKTVVQKMSILVTGCAGFINSVLPGREDMLPEPAPSYAISKPDCEHLARGVFRSPPVLIDVCEAGTVVQRIGASFGGREDLRDARDTVRVVERR